jgi:hypothetical protein
VKNARPPGIVSATSAGLKDLYYNRGEQEWRVGDYHKLKPPS